MTTVNMTLHLKSENKDLVEAFKTFISNFKDVSSFEIEQKNENEFIPRTKKEIEGEFREALKDIKSGKAFEEADDFENIFTQI